MMTTIVFLLALLPTSLILYYAAGKGIREYVLLAISWLFYFLFSPKYMPIFLLAIGITIIMGRAIVNVDNRSTQKCILVLGILLNAGILIFCKMLQDYSGIVLKSGAEQILLPIGVSVTTLKAISYLADCYLGKVKPSGSPVRDALYLSFFPQIQSGPFSRYSEFEKEPNCAFDIDGFSQGVYRFLCGFGKKILLADVLANIVDEVFSSSLEGISTSYVWLGAVCYSLQLYFDFSGYSDMAIGVSNMFGYKCRENFRNPYLTQSVSDFWRRWHISLGEWFRDYVYIPLGGSRTKNRIRLIGNLLTVWLLTGIWHGFSLNFILWGLGHFVAISIEKLVRLPQRIKWPIVRFGYRIIVLLFVISEWVMFRITDASKGIKFLLRMFTLHVDELFDRRTLFLLRDYRFFIIAAIVFCFPLDSVLNGFSQNRKLLGGICMYGKAIFVLICFAMAISFVVAGQNNPFLYANF